jgi:hypothetical protein
MKKILPVLILLCLAGCSGNLKPSENIKKNFSGEILDTSKRSVVVILPFKNLAGVKKYASSVLIGRIFYNGIMNVVGYFPSFDVPDKKVLDKLPFVSNWSGVADFIIAGDYDLSGDRHEPDAKVRLTIWSKMTGLTFTNEIKTKTDTEIFDAVDQMISGIVKVTLKEEAKFALMRLDEFNTGREKFDIYVNRKYLASVTNDGFSLGLKVLPDRPYLVTLVRIADWKEVLNQKIVMSPESVTDVGYDALGKIGVELMGQKPNDPYKIYLDGNEVGVSSFPTNIAAGRTHVIRKMNVLGNYSYQSTFSLRDGEERTIPLYNRDSDLYDIDRDSAYIAFGGRNVWLTNGGVPVLYQEPKARDVKGNFSGNRGLINGYIVNVNESNTLHFWCQSDPSNLATGDFKIIIADRDRELFVYYIRDMWGTKRFEVPFGEFRSYVWQQSEELNGEIDYPIDSVYFNYERTPFSVMGLFFNRNEPFRK